MGGYFPSVANSTLPNEAIAAAPLVIGAQLQPLTLDIHVTYELGG